MTTIRMIRADDGKTGDIHPDEVEHMKAHGWAVDETEEQSGAALDGAIDIPADWDALHWKQQVALAEKLTGREDIAKAEEAREIIAAEVAKRG